MTTEHTPTGLIGASIRRVEDRPLITGAGCFTEDIQIPGMLHLAFVRSPYPHAKIISIDTSAAKAMAGVIAVVTGDDLSERLHVQLSRWCRHEDTASSAAGARGRPRGWHAGGGGGC